MEDLAAVAAAGALGVEIGVEGEEGEVRAQVALHTLKARRLLLIDFTVSFKASKLYWSKTFYILVVFVHTLLPLDICKLSHHSRYSESSARIIADKLTQLPLLYRFSQRVPTWWHSPNLL